MEQTWPQLLAHAQGSGAAITAAAETSALPVEAKVTIPPNYFVKVGKKLKIKASGKITSLITTPGVAQWKVKFGASIAFDGLAILLDSVAAHTNVGWRLEIDLRLNNVGSAALWYGSGEWKCEDILGVAATMPKADAVALLPWNGTPAPGAAIDLTASQVVDLTFTQSVATGSMTLMSYELWEEN